MTTATTEHYRAYSPKPFTRAERDSVTVVFGGLHWRVERIIQAVLESVGNKAEVLPVATKEDLLTGREVADIGQCCPTSFTTGNLVNFIKKKSDELGAEEVTKKYVYLTAGSCGACRFGQYHQSYELGLRNSGLGDAADAELEARPALDAGIFLEALEPEPQEIVHPDRDGGGVDLRAFRLEPAVDVVIGIAFHGLEVELARDLDGGLHAQPVDLDGRELAVDLAQGLREVRAREVPGDGAPGVAGWTGAEDLVEILHALLDHGYH